MLTDKDQAIVKAFFAMPPGKTQKDLALDLGIPRSAVRDALCRAKRAGIDTDRRHTRPEPKKVEPQREDVVTATVPKPSIGRLDAACMRSTVSLRRISFISDADDRPLGRIVTPVPQVNEADIIRQRRVAMIREIHQSGLRRGLFRIGSR